MVERVAVVCLEALAIEPGGILAPEVYEPVNTGFLPDFGMFADLRGVGGSTASHR